MWSDRLLVALGCTVAVAWFAGCGGGDESDGAGSAAAPSEGKAPRQPPFTGAPADQAPRGFDPAVERYVQRANARCKRIGSPGAISVSAESLEARAKEMLGEARVLRRLDRVLRRLRVPGRAAARIRGYRRTVRDQAFLDRRIARAAQAGDEQAVTVGMHQNEQNRKRRSKLAKRLGFSRCLWDREPR